MKHRIESIWRQADAAGRSASREECAEVERLLAGIERKKGESAMRAKLNGEGSWERSGTYGEPLGLPGDVFIKSDGYARIKDATARPQKWSSGVVEVSTGPLDAKGTLTESTVGGPGGGLVPPQYQPGIVETLMQPLEVPDLFATSPTTASQVRYVVEGTATSGAAGVAEGGTKPESTLALSEVQEPVRKVATTLPVTDELLEDAPSIQAYLNSRLSLFVKVEEERQLLRGAGGGSNELVGLVGRSGINTYTKLAADDNATSLARVLANTRGSSHLTPTGIILHPSNWLSTRLLRDGLGGTAGQFLGGGPFTGAYGQGGAANAGLFGASLWGVPVALSTTVGLGTAVVGSFAQGARIWRRGGVSVEASNSHSSYFVEDRTMLRAESRLGLAVYRPGAFCVVSGLA